MTILVCDLFIFGPAFSHLGPSNPAHLASSSYWCESADNNCWSLTACLWH